MGKIFFIKDSIFASKADIWVNPVNTKGVSGGGLAKLFKEKFPVCFDLYHERCKKNELEIGKLLVTSSEDFYHQPQLVIHFPTKNHWADFSKIEFIDQGMESLKKLVKNLDKDRYRAIAIPALGCGLGGLTWDDVKPVILKHAAQLDMKVEIYLPNFKK